MFLPKDHAAFDIDRKRLAVWADIRHLQWGFAQRRDYRELRQHEEPAEKWLTYSTSELARVPTNLLRLPRLPLSIVERVTRNGWELLGVGTTTSKPVSCHVRVPGESSPSSKAPHRLCFAHSLLLALSHLASTESEFAARRHSGPRYQHRGGARCLRVPVLQIQRTQKHGDRVKMITSRHRKSRKP
jgi:hypothetical protein